MIDIILILKFVHVLAVALLFGGWLAVALFVVFASRTGSASAVVLIGRFATRIELSVVAAAGVVAPLSGFPLAQAIGLSPSDEFWIAVSLVIYLIVVAAWLASVFFGLRMRKLARDAARNGAVLPASYRRLFRLWSALAVLILIGLIVVIAMMIWQPRWS